MKEVIKIGILIDSFVLCKWEYAVIERIKNLEFVKIQVIVINKQPAHLSSAWNLFLKKLNNIFYFLHLYFDRKILSSGVDYFHKRSCKNLLFGINIIEVVPIRKKYTDQFSKDDVVKLKEFELDVIIRFGFRILKGDILNTAKLGIWSHHHGDNRVFRGTPPGYWEYFKNEGTIGAILQVVSEELDAGIVIDSCVVPNNQISIHRNLQNLYWKSTTFIERTLVRLHNYGFKEFEIIRRQKNPEYFFYSSELFRIPNNITALNNLINHILRLFLFVLKEYFTRHHWDIYILRIKENKVFGIEFRKFKKLRSPKGVFWADPFLFSENGKSYLFFEEYLNGLQRGNIALLELDRIGTFEKTTTLLDLGVHLSYPFVFKYEEKYFMIPETSSTSCIQLFQAENFPYDWKLKAKLFSDIKAVDTTMIYYNNIWWMFFCADFTHGKSKTMDELYLYYSDSLLSGNWKPHRMNPINTDCRSSRPAGKIFSHSNQLFRPSQASDKGVYGKKIRINRISILTTEEYEEECVAEVLPKWEKGILGTHTFCFDDSFIVVDAFRKKVF